MMLFERSAGSVFGSKSLIGHLLRGLAGFGAVYWAFTHQSESVLPVLAIGAAFSGVFSRTTPQKLEPHPAFEACA